MRWSLRIAKLAGIDIFIHFTFFILLTWVALAGPAVNIGIVIVLAIYLFITNSFAPVNRLTMSTAPFIERILGVNIFLVLFNMVPAFPMDGGRVLRALLATRLAYIKATQVAANLGQGIALLFGVIGLFYNPILLFIAFFVWMGAAQETRMTHAKSALDRIP
jgi:Zn-dependent protease